MRAGVRSGWPEMDLQQSVLVLFFGSQGQVSADLDIGESSRVRSWKMSRGWKSIWKIVDSVCGLC